MSKLSPALLVCFLSVSTLHAQQYSDLWGKDGEKWKPDSRLPDFSYAGYHCGEDPIPKIKGPILNVTK